jgi:hypothetical protein
MSLNTEETKCEAERLWGKIIHPTIVDLIALIWDFWDSIRDAEPNTAWEDLVLWKMDLRGAYTLLSVHPDCAALFALELRNGLTFIPFCGVFGWTAIPFIFQAVTRACKWELRHVIKGACDMYVDDVFGVTLRRNLDHDLRVARIALTDLLGETAVADHKTEASSRLDIIGWRVDLSGMFITIAGKNLLNAFYAFFLVDTGSKVPLREMQKLASLSSRYSLVCPAMRPFTAALNGMITGFSGAHARISVSPDARLAIVMWRAMFFLMSRHDSRFARSLQSFRNKPFRIGLQTDASLTGAGGFFFERMEDGTEVVKGGFAATLVPLGFGCDSSFQNCAEFIGIILGLLALALMGVRDADLEIRGDSMSALAWASTSCFRSSTATKPSMVFTLVCIAFGFNIREATHISGRANWQADILSRASAGYAAGISNAPG